MRSWWQDAVLYQIVTPSFLDANGDGRGDLRGVIDRLDYLVWLGVRGIWLTPIHASPFADLGYDVTDFRSVAPELGSLEDVDELVDQAHRRQLKIIMDWVPNHTSAEHPWFAESRSSRDAARRDWYIWRDGRPDGSPPTNWISVFGGSVWQWDDATGQFYMHTFLDRQPDLNWRHPDVQAAMLDVLRFWLDRGVDGFRVDALDLLLEDEDLRDNPPNPDYQEGDGPDSRLLPRYTRNQPGTHELVETMRAVLDDYGDDRVLAGELYLPAEDVVEFYGDPERPELHLPLNMRLAWIHWNADEIGQAIEEYDRLIPAHGWPTWTLSTHDCPRLAARCRGEQTRVAAMLLATLRGTPTHYYGEEIGMRGTPIPADDAIDPQGRRTGRNRDPERTPMQWSGEMHAGFSAVEPWLPITDDFKTANVASQSDDPHSLLTLYRRLYRLRGEYPALVAGRYEPITHQHPWLAFQRVSDDQRVVVLLNFDAGAHAFDLKPEQSGRVLLSTFLDRDEEVAGSVELRGNEGLLVLVG